MLEFFDKPTVSAYEIHGRLLPARVLETSGIPSVVFSEDALAFVHFVPTLSFDFTVLVPDERVQEAVECLQKELPQYQVTQERSYRMTDKSGVCALPRAVRLEWDEAKLKEKLDHRTPWYILVVPQSHFHFDVNDGTRVRGLIPPFDPSDARIRFPTLPAFINSLIDTMFEPVEGVSRASHLRFQGFYLGSFLSYLCIYNIRDEDGAKDPETGELLPAAQALLEGVKPENVALLETYLRTGSMSILPELSVERQRLKAERLAISRTDLDSHFSSLGRAEKRSIERTPKWELWSNSKKPHQIKAYYTHARDDPDKVKVDALQVQPNAYATYTKHHLIKSLEGLSIANPALLAIIKLESLAVRGNELKLLNDYLDLVWCLEETQKLGLAIPQEALDVGFPSGWLRMYGRLRKVAKAPGQVEMLTELLLQNGVKPLVPPDL